jgi:hypothetical protein
MNFSQIYTQRSMRSGCIIAWLMQYSEMSGLEKVSETVRNLPEIRDKSSSFHLQMQSNVYFHPSRHCLV